MQLVEQLKQKTKILQQLPECFGRLSVAEADRSFCFLLRCDETWKRITGFTAHCHWSVPCWRTGPLPMGGPLPASRDPSLGGNYSADPVLAPYPERRLA